MSQKLVNNFLKELKYRVDLKSNSKQTEEKVLLKTFKFFDLSNKNQSDFKTFLKVTRNLGMVNFSEDELLMAFEHYTRGNLTLNYREFITEIYDKNVTLLESVTNESYYNTKSFTNSKYDTVDEWELVRKLINMMIYRLRKQSLFSFLSFFKDIRNFDTSNSDSISRGNFRIACQRSDLELGHEDVDKVFDFFRVNEDSMVVSKFVECLCNNYTDSRVQAVRKMFGRFDFNNQKKINLGLVKETFNAKLYFDVRNGRKTQEEIEFQFNEYVSTFIRMNLGNLNLRSEEFLTFMKLLSAHIKRDMDFLNFIENSFRYNELPRKGSNVQLRDSVQDTHSLMDKEFSVLTTGNIDEQEHQLRVELAKRGNKAMIVFYHNLRSNDYDGDGKVYIKEFENSINESRVSLPVNTVKRLFKAHSRDGALDYQRFMSSLVFQFEPARLEMVKDLYRKFFTSHYSDSVPVSKVVEHFFARGHPEFRKGLRQDYDIAGEFEESLRSFLMTYQGNQTHVSLAGFVRFIEFYCFLFNEDTFYYFIENAFKFKFFNRDKAKKEYISKQAEMMSRDVPEQSNMNVDRSTFNRVFGSKEFAAKPQPDQLRNQLPQDTGSIRQSRRGNPVTDYNQPKQYNAPQMSPSQFSPHNESVISRKSENMEDLNKINNKLMTANFKKSEVPKNDQFSGVLTSRLIKNIRLSGNFTILLEIEYEMTRKSDTGGNVDFDVFSSVLESVGCLTGFNDTNINDLFMSNLEKGQLHVQRFVNDLRGQITEKRETWVIEKFDLLRNPATDTIHIEDVRKAFRPKQFKWRKQSVADVTDNYQYMIDLFNCLNLAIKKTTEFDLDDFLYLFDNFSFMFEDDKDFKQMIDFCF
jgi:Ca2+-binding EF-hand superfamily protein